MLTTLASVAPPASSTLSRLSSVRRVCTSISPSTTVLVEGSSGPWPDTNSMLPNRMACAIGGGFCRSVKPVVGALAEVTNCLGTLRFLSSRRLGRLRQRVGHHRAAFLARPRIFVVEEALVGQRHRVGPIVADDKGFLVQEIAAALAVP